MTNNPHLLSTAPLNPEMEQRAADAGVKLDVVSFVATTPLLSIEVTEEIAEMCMLPVTAVFTSANAVRAIAATLQLYKPDWSIYCIGHATKNAVLEHFAPAAIAGYSRDSASLAQLILTNDVYEVVFFCGDQRMDTLPELLTAGDITVHEVQVYQTTATPKALSAAYSAALFFSPSAVRSFFSANAAHIVGAYFAIGATTAAEIARHTDKPIYTSPEPAKDTLAEMAIEYCTKQAKS